MEPHPAIVVAMDRVDVRDEVHLADLQAGFFFQFPVRRLFGGLAEFLRTARQRPAAKIRRLAAANEKHLTRPQHDDANADIGAIRVFTAHRATPGVVP